MVDVSVGHAGEELFEVLSLVALPALPVGLQVGVETLHFVLAFLHLDWHLWADERKLQLQGPSRDIMQTTTGYRATSIWGLCGTGVMEGRVVSEKFEK